MQTDTRPTITEQQRVCSNPNCPHRGQPQPLDSEHFAPNAHYAGGYKTRCRNCERKTRRERYQRKRDQELAYNKEWVESHRDERNTYQRERSREIMSVYKAATGGGEQSA